MRHAYFIVAGSLALLLACAPAHSAPASSNAAAAPDTSSKGPAAPAGRQYSYAYDMLDNSVIRPLTRSLDVALLARKVTRQPREAANVDEQDQVRLPSTWWQPRIGLRPVTVEQMLSGPGPGTGPAPGKWTVTKAKLQGVTPGFQIKDSQGGKFLVKFDPPGSAELATSCDVIGSRLFWAAGYNVPDNSIGSFSLDDLDIAKDGTYTDASGKKQPMTRAYLEQLLQRVSPPIAGRYRCTTSRLLAGKPLGAFEYFGRRADDPEDKVPHELRRELRGLWVVCAWLNHADSRGPNSLDMWVTDHDRSFVRHHLIDFSAILGAGATGKRAYATGTEYYLDYGVAGRELITAGLAPFRWEASVDPNIPAIGFVESKVFDPGSWRPDYPNPAFDERTERDNRWGARIVAGFTNDHIRAAVGAAHYSDPRTAEAIVQVLIERRDKLIHRWLGNEHTAGLATQSRDSH